MLTSQLLHWYPSVVGLCWLRHSGVFSLCLFALKLSCLPYQTFQPHFPPTEKTTTSPCIGLALFASCVWTLKILSLLKEKCVRSYLFQICRTGPTPLGRPSCRHGSAPPPPAEPPQTSCAGSAKTETGARRRWPPRGSVVDRDRGVYGAFKWDVVDTHQHIGCPRPCAQAHHEVPQHWCFSGCL